MGSGTQHSERECMGRFNGKHRSSTREKWLSQLRRWRGLRRLKAIWGAKTLGIRHEWKFVSRLKKGLRGRQGLVSRMKKLTLNPNIQSLEPPITHKSSPIIRSNSCDQCGQQNCLCWLNQQIQAADQEEEMRDEGSQMQNIYLYASECSSMSYQEYH